MSDTVKINVTTTWTAIPGLTLGSTYAFQNIVDKVMYLRQQLLAPASSDTGFELGASKTAILIKEANPIYVRSQQVAGTAYLNELA